MIRLAMCCVLLAACGGASSSRDDGGAPEIDAQIGSDGSVDGSVDAPGQVICEGIMCRADQTCTAGGCTFACTGSSVPGDYATIQGAIDALAAAGQDATICLADTTYNQGQLFVRDPGSHGKALRIIGASMDRTMVNAETFVTSGWSSVTIQGVHLVMPNTGTALRVQGGADASLTLIGTKLTGQTGIEAYLRANIVVDSCEIAANGGYGVSLFANITGPLTMRIVNSYLHGGYSVRTDTNGFAVDLTFVNNIVVGSQVGVYLSGATTALLANNIFTGTTAAAMQWFSPTTITKRNNALWNNAANYGGLATDGPGYVKTDCLLDSTGRTPSLLAGSPCRDAGDGSIAPAHDYYGTLRGTPPDLGAVEAP